MIYRELEPHEFANAPREVEGSDVFTPENSKILAAINDKGEIVATWTFFVCAHIEPVWVREDYRGKGMILGRLGNAMKSMLRAMNVRDVYTVVLDKTPVLRKFAYWFGAKPVSGTLFRWQDDQSASVTGEEQSCQ